MTTIGGQKTRDRCVAADRQVVLVHTTIKVHATSEVDRVIARRERGQVIEETAWAADLRGTDNVRCCHCSRDRCITVDEQLLCAAWLTIDDHALSVGCTGRTECRDTLHLVCAQEGVRAIGRTVVIDRAGAGTEVIDVAGARTEVIRRACARTKGVRRARAITEGIGKTCACSNVRRAAG